MQFQYNSDYPGVAEDGSARPVQSESPPEFPPVQPIPCARLTTRIYHPSRNQVATVQNVLVKTMIRPPNLVPTTANGAGGDSMSSSSDDMSSTSSEDEMMVDIRASMTTAAGGLAATAAAAGPGPNATSTAVEEEGEERAYWIQRTVREAIYGRVLFAVVLRRRTTQSGAANDNAEWEVTPQNCAVKEMSWQHIRRERDRLAEDPIKEVASMQFLKQWHCDNNSDKPRLSDGVLDSFRTMLETNIMMPLDLLSDDRNLYSVMPYCDGGELFERLDMHERFSEPEARYWMYQVLNGLENLQTSGICHRDMSLENLLVHETGALIIDMGMCLRIPYQDSGSAAAGHLSASFGKMSMNGGNGPVAAVDVPQSVENKNGAIRTRGRSRPRWLIRPQGTCGKWIYMSPEIYKNKTPFDGYAVDMWAAGVILFLMLTGFPPWERACQTDERFKYMTSGYLVQMLTEWEIGISSDAMDLLQRMLWVDPKDRLSLDQVREHPWMKNGPLAPPVNLAAGMQP